MDASITLSHKRGHVDQNQFQTALDAGAISQEFTYGDGSIEFSFLSAKYCMMGLSSYNTDPGSGLDYGIFAHINGYINIWERGTQVPSIGKNGSIRITFAASDNFRVERTGSVVRYKKNGQTFYTSQIPSIGAIYADCSFGSYQAAITVRNFELGLSWTGAVDQDWNKTGNWSGNRVPGALDQVSITNCTTCPVLSSDVAVGALRLFSSNINLNQYTLAINHAALFDSGLIESNRGRILSNDFTEVKNSTITGSIVLVKTGGTTNSWYGGNHLSPEVQLINQSGQTWKLSTQTNNEVH